MKVNYQVEQALSENLQARSSDKVLLLQVWHRLGLDLTTEQTKKFLDLPTPETIRRVRQKLQEQGKYPADESVTKERNFMAATVQQNAPSATPERLSNLIQGRFI